ncbi:MAG TPA: ATP-binding protein [Anaerolineae bacterium]|nr:ATP-binding protein [Anaerolineae bacterium]
MQEKKIFQKKFALTTADRGLLERPQFSFRLHMSLVFIFFSLFSIAIIVGSVIAINRIQKKLYFVQASERYLFEIEQARRWEKNYFLYGTNLENAIQCAYNAKSLLSQNLQKLITVLSAEQTETIVEHLDRYSSLLQELMLLEKNRIDSREKKSKIETSLRKYGAEMVKVAAALVYKEQDSMNAMLHLIQRIPLYSLVVVLLIGVFVARFLVQRLIKPLKHLIECTQRIAKGDFSPLKPIRKYRDEFTTVEVAINRMLKQLKSHEAAMVESHKLRAVGTLTAGVAHELNNPLNNIMLTAHAMLEDHKELSEDELLEMLNDLIGEANRSRSIVRNLLDFARESESVSEPLDLGALVNDTIKLALNQVKVSGAKIETQIQPNLPKIRGDTQQLKQVFLNLILNALDAVDKNGKIIINVKESEISGFLAVQIEDNGCGIPAHILPNIFDPFFTTKGPGKGTGLGLSVSHGIIIMHGGQINLETEEGKYTRFTVTLPSRNIPADFNKT